MLDINLWLMVSVAVIFLVTMMLLNQWLFKPIIAFMEEREAKLEEQMKMINANSHDSEELEKEIEELLRNAKHEAAKIREEAKAKALAEIQELKEKKQAEIEDAKAKLAKEIEAEKERILNELSKESNVIKSMIENKIRNVA
jgi:F-type H+-transporting ATPase subunit b